MPGMMDTVLNLGLNDGVRRGAGGAHRQPALRVGLLPPARADVRRRRARRAQRALRGRDRADQARARRHAGHRARHRRAARADGALQGALRLPHRPARAARAGHPRGLRLVDGRARRRLPAHQPHPRRLGHGGQRPADGLRQQGPDLGLRRGLLARRGHRGARAQRRLPHRRPGRGRGLRACARRATSPSSPSGCPRRTRSCSRSCAQLERHYGDMQDTEFTIEEGRLYMLQTRAPSGPRRPPCASRSTRCRRAC